MVRSRNVAQRAQAAAAHVDAALLDAWRTGYRDLKEEHDYWVQPSQIEGEVPAGLQGTLYQACAGRVESAGGLLQPTQADGAAVSVAFRGGRAFVRSRHLSGPLRIGPVRT
jgi:carotenoid cleavage dioxygenase-like enzyme